MAALDRKPRTKQERYRQYNDFKRRSERIYILNIHKKWDAELIEWLEENKPYAGAIKWLIAEQIKREKAELEQAKET